MSAFTATLEPVPHGGCFVVVPANVAEAAGLKHGDRVRGRVNGAAYRSSLMKYSGVFHLGVHKATLAAAGAKLRDGVRVTIERDPDPLPNDRVPEELARALKKNKTAAAAFAALAPSHRREYVGFVVEAKRPETRERRITKTIEALIARRG
jgi:bifunctional DNA-binding transcriptional regulator/antitoxin component of YhaV-PrlF toxin-antitoxin module